MLIIHIGYDYIYAHLNGKKIPLNKLSFRKFGYSLIAIREELEWGREHITHDKVMVYYNGNKDSANFWLGYLLGTMKF